MSKQLAISVAFSIFAMAAFALFATPNALTGDSASSGHGIAGAPMEIGTPASLPQLPDLPSLPVILD